jgi:selenocysteine lyase/cysteine desulfurase
MQSQRHLFNIPPDIAYFNGAYMSPQLKTVEIAGMEALQRKGRPFDISVEDFFSPVQRLKTSFAQLINTSEPDRIAILPSVSYGLAQVVNNIKAPAGSNIVLMEEQFPSNYYSWKRLAEQQNISLRVVSAPEGFPRSKAWNDAILANIDQHTVAVSMGHVHWADGTLFDLETISQKAKSVGALLVIDGTQSVGALPFDLARIQPDALICGGYKWLMGPYSIGLGYFGPAFDDGVPIEENWINRKNSADFKT